MNTLLSQLMQKFGCSLSLLIFLFGYFYPPLSAPFLPLTAAGWSLDKRSAAYRPFFLTNILGLSLTLQ